MKHRLLPFTICLLGICNLPAQWSFHEGEIILTEVMTIDPMDDCNNGEQGGSPDPTKFRATQDGNTITVGTTTDALVHVTVRNQATGAVAVSQDFVEIVMFNVMEEGIYNIRIASEDTAVEGYFTIY